MGGYYDACQETYNTSSLGHDTTLRFGKYQGETIEDVYELDPNYCAWLINQEILIGNSPGIKNFLQEKLKDSDASMRMRWGKHKGKSVKWIKENDKNYFDWLLNNKYTADNCPTLKT